MEAFLIPDHYGSQGNPAEWQEYWAVAQEASVLVLILLKTSWVILGISLVLYGNTDH